MARSKSIIRAFSTFIAFACDCFNAAISLSNSFTRASYTFASTVTLSTPIDAASAASRNSRCTFSNPPRSFTNAYARRHTSSSPSCSRIACCNLNTSSRAPRSSSSRVASASTTTASPSSRCGVPVDVAPAPRSASRTFSTPPRSRTNSYVLRYASSSSSVSRSACLSINTSFCAFLSSSRVALTCASANVSASSLPVRSRASPTATSRPRASSAIARRACAARAHGE
mmetsp:Transcript_3279/g.11828  ORF Transcript_3279/g.11828 Transcript_3279/m.11828 type:complete len:228 (-) Transcript_3279:14-697(-)